MKNLMLTKNVVFKSENNRLSCKPKKAAQKYSDQKH